MSLRQVLVVVQLLMGLGLLGWGLRSGDQSRIMRGTVVTVLALAMWR